MLKTLYPVHDRLFELVGEKAPVFLHGQLTNHIKNLADGSSCYNFLLNQKGKIQADLHVYHNAGRWFVAVTDRSVAVVLEHLQKLAPLSGIQILEVKGVKIFHFPKQNDDTKDVATPPFTVDFFVKSRRFFTDGFDCVVSDLSKLSSMMIATPEETERFRLQQGVPKFGVDFNENNLAQETSILSALHFDKGCYLGQEIVARLHYRGHVNRKLVRFQIKGPVAGLPELFDAHVQQSGFVTSVFFDSSKNESFGLACVNFSALEKKEPLFLDGAPIFVFPVLG